jgi:hypothetical protein
VRRRIGAEELVFSSREDVDEFLRQCKEDRPDQYDPVDILRDVVGICPISFLTPQTEYLLSVVGYFINEGGIHTFPYPLKGIDNPALFFQAAACILDETHKAEREKISEGGEK